VNEEIKQMNEELKSLIVKNHKEQNDAVSA